MTLLKIIGWLLVPSANVYIDYWLIEQRRSGVNHILETIFRGIAMILYGGLVFKSKTPGLRTWAFQWAAFISRAQLLGATEFGCEDSIFFVNPIAPPWRGR